MELAPFFLLSPKNFLVVFFLMVQVILIEDVHLLQFFTKPALNIHIVVTFPVDVLEKNQLFGELSRHYKRNSSYRNRAPRL